ncbi:MAG: metalloregulator ArsR/SmtB family transcription factor [Patescibacteria group bacterium]
MNKENRKPLERLFKAVANERRLVIIDYLKKHKQATVGEIAAHLKLSFAATSRHLSLLYNVDILEREQKSLEIYCSLSNKLPKNCRRIIDIC